MERTVPKIASEEIELYLRTLYSLLRSTTEIQIRTLEEVHAGMNSLLHPFARHSALDTSAFIYSLLRLPDCMADVKVVALGQSTSVFENHGYLDVESWTPVITRARRRRCFYDDKDKLACFIASRSDIEDVIPAMTAYQIEWNKLHIILNQLPVSFEIEDVMNDPSKFSILAGFLQLPEEDLRKFEVIWENRFVSNLKRIKNKKCDLRVNLLAGSLSEYWRATHAWWDHIERSNPLPTKRPVYFISSNPHSIPNLLSGFALKNEDLLINFLQNSDEEILYKEFDIIKNQQEKASLENLLYYVLKKAQQTPKFNYLRQEQLDNEIQNGIIRINSQHYFDVDAQIIELSKYKFL